MQMTDSQRIAAPREQVWVALNDPEVLKRCIPGCKSLEMTSPNEMTASVVLKVGPVKAKFAGKVTLSELDPPNGYRITGEGSGGVAGFAKGGATVRLEEDGPDVTILHYEVDAQIGGKLAQLGGRLIDSTAKKLAAEFFDNLAGILAPAAPEPMSEEAGESTVKKGWLGGLFSKPGTATTLIALIVAGALLGHACLFYPAEAGMAEGFPICTGLAGTV